MPKPIRKKLSLEVYVVSRSRFERSDTLERLEECASRVRLVVPSSQLERYKQLANQYGCKLLGCPADGIALTRQFCGEQCQSDKFLMLDDDLKFYRRISKTDSKLRHPRELDCSISSMLLLVERCLDSYVHVAISAREGNNRLVWSGADCSRPLRALAYQRDKFLSVVHGRVEIMEDFDVTLQLLRKGYKNHVIACWAQNQSQTQMPGGCSDYRTRDLHATNVQKLARLHSPFVRLRKKRNKSGGEFGTRLEATIYWKKAYQSSQE